MKKLGLLLTLICLIISNACFAATFTATVDSDQVASGVGVLLQLTLTGAHAKGDPEVQVLNNDFEIGSTGHTSEMSYVNGQMSTEVNWQLSLLPKRTGHIAIPPISIETDAGKLTTQPVNIDVSNSGSARAASSQGSTVTSERKPLTFEALVTHSDPYQNQPVLYTLRIVTHVTISDLSLGDVTAENAIIQPQGKPEVTDTVEDGQQTKIIDIKYLITPIDAKHITIPSVTLKGNLEADVQRPRMPVNPGGLMDPMEMLQQMSGMSGFRQMRPFSIKSNPVALEVKPPVAGMSPWLPLKSLHIEEKSDNAQAPRVGEPWIRKFVMTADGMDGGLLPSLEPQLSGGDFKAYADKPVTSQMVDSHTGDIVGEREESYSLIPQKSGRVSVPPVKITWWNVKENRAETTEVPSRTVDILPAAQTAEAQTPPPAANAAMSAPASTPVSVPPAAREGGEQRDTYGLLLWGGVATGFMILIGGFGFWVVRLKRQLREGQKSIPSVGERVPPIFTPVRGSSKEISWGSLSTAKELNDAIIFHAVRVWDAPSNASLVAALSACPRFDELQTQISAVIRDIEGDLYAGRRLDLDIVRANIRLIIDTSSNSKAARQINKDEKLDLLNPT